MTERLLNIGQTAAFLGISRDTCSLGMRMGQIPCIPCGKRLYASPAQLRAWLGIDADEGPPPGPPVGARPRYR
jgi:hypothetical protein